MILFVLALGAADPLDFDLLGPASRATTAPDNLELESAVKTRRIMLNLHQGFGISMLVLMASTMVVGQISYYDRFMGGPSTGRFEATHAVLAYSTFTLFVGTGALALFAPSPFKPKELTFDRTVLHRIGMYGAAVGMLTQIILGIVTRQQEGFTAQRDLAVSHLAIGYVTLGLSTLGVGALLF